MSRAARVERLRHALLAAERCTAGELAERLGVSRRTVLRDLAYLREQGLAIEGEAGPGGGLRLLGERGVASVHMTFDEVISLWMAASLAHKASSLPWGRAARGALDKLLASVPASRARELRSLLRSVVVGPPASPAVAASARAPSGDLLPRVEEAMRRRKLLAFDYTDRNGASSRREAEPHGLLIQPPVWYILAVDARKREPRMFRMDRIARATALEGRFFSVDLGVVAALTRDLRESHRALS